MLACWYDYGDKAKKTPVLLSYECNLRGDSAIPTIWRDN
jgi:hypothetical protein